MIYKMNEKGNLNGNVRELKIGASFTNSKAPQYHSIKYDFKPASVDVTKMATVDVEANHQVTVTVPHLDGAGVPQTVFKGSQRPYSKECVLIIDRTTGEITLEKLSSNIQVKKTRQESLSKPRPLTPQMSDFNMTQRSTSRTKVASGARRNHNGLQNNGKGNVPSNIVQSPPRVKTSPPEAAPWCGGASTMASLPLIGLDDTPPVPPPTLPNISLPPVQVPQLPNIAPEPEHDASSSSSSSDSGSDSDSDTPTPAPRSQNSRPNLNGNSAPLYNDVLLKDDLQLSESGSESE